MNIKHQLFIQCEAFVNKRLQTVEEIISSNQNALQSETKSSAGDKHETGRAMLQLEMEKAGQQLSGIIKMREILSKINIGKISETAHLGSVVKTNKAFFFISISAGQLIIKGKTYFAISVSSPIGSMLLGKKVGDIFIFNKVEQKIKEIF